MNMNQNKIVFFEIEPWEKEYVSQFFPRDSTNYTCHKLTLENAKDFADGSILSTFIYSDLSSKVLSQFPNLKMVTTRSTGFEHIDIEACRKRGVAVTNVPSYGENTVAEHTFALILTLSRNVHKAYSRMKNSERFSFEGLQGFDLKGKTLGVIGAGHIGMHVIKMARGFSMNVVAYDVNRSSLIAEVLNFRYVSLEELLSTSDIISIHAPYNKHTHQMINQSNIHLIKRGALLINTARGGIVETRAILNALNEGILAGAGLDVLEGEKLIREEKEILTENYTPEELRLLIINHQLMNKENVVITPHIGFHSKEAAQRILETTVENIHSYLAGNPVNTVY